MKKAISTKQTAANIAAVLELLRDTPGRLASLSAALSPKQRRLPMGAGERSLTEVVAHLINCEARTAESICLTLLVDEPFCLDIHPERQWGSLLQHEAFDFADLLPYFTFRRKVLLGVLQKLSDVQWARVNIEQDKQRKESIYWRARALALHEAEHVAELQLKLGGLAQK
jgi:hypothetical protein